MEHVEAYQELEQARFPKRVKVETVIAEDLYDVLVPPFLIQLLVDNVFKHAFGNRKEDNKVAVFVTEIEKKVRIQVTDNGQGIAPEKIPYLGNEVVESTSGTGSVLENLNRRLVSLFGQQGKLQFDSTKEGTTVSCTIPIKRGD